MHVDGLLRAAAVAATVAALYGATLGHELVWDDRLTAAAATNARRALAPTGAFHRPLVMLSFALDHALWGGAAWGFHLTNLVLHAAVSWTVGALAVALGTGGGAALAASLLFAAHPVQTEAVTYVSGRTDVLCALFVLLALLAWRRARQAADGWAVAAAAAFAAALLSKEAAVLVPLVLLVPGAHPAPDPPRPVLPLAVAGLWIAWFAASTPLAPSTSGLAARLPAMAGMLLDYARLLLWPSDLHLERFVAVPGWSVPAALAAWLGVGVIAAALAALAWRAPGGAVLLALAATAYAPVSGLIPVYRAVADRVLFAAEHFLYLPLAGLMPLLAGAWAVRAALVPGRRARAGGPVLVAALLAAWGWVVVDRNRDWRDEKTLFRHTVAFDPPTARVWYNLGNLELAAGEAAEAERLYRAALARAPTDAVVHWNLGIALQRQGRTADALAHYREATRLDPRLAGAR